MAWHALETIPTNTQWAHIDRGSDERWQGRERGGRGKQKQLRQCSGWQSSGKGRGDSNGNERRNQQPHWQTETTAQISLDSCGRTKRQGSRWCALRSTIHRRRRLRTHPTEEIVCSGTDLGRLDTNTAATMALGTECVSHIVSTISRRTDSLKRTMLIGRWSTSIREYKMRPSVLDTSTTHDSHRAASN